MKCSTAFALFIIATSNFCRTIARETIDKVISSNEGEEWIMLGEYDHDIHDNRDLKGKTKGKGKSKSKAKSNVKSKNKTKSKG